jgi:[ribosomal protein S5]-alanine N-acetyltransferase
MNDSPILKSERLLLRVPQVQDAERLADYVLRNRDHLAPWEPSRHAEYFTLAFWLDEITRLECQRLADQAVSFILLARDRPDGPILGRTSITNIVRGSFQAGHLGFALANASVGHGLMFEALLQVIAFAFTCLNLHRILANYQPDNQRSATLLRKLGFHVEGMAKEYLFLNGAWRDHVLTSLVNPEFRAAELPSQTC